MFHESNLILRGVKRSGAHTISTYSYGSSRVLLDCSCREAGGGMASSGSRTLSVTARAGEGPSPEELYAILFLLGFDPSLPVRSFHSARRPASGDRPTQFYCQSIPPVRSEHLAAS